MTDGLLRVLVERRCDGLRLGADRFDRAFDETCQHLLGLGDRVRVTFPIPLETTGPSHLAAGALAGAAVRGLIRFDGLWAHAQINRPSVIATIDLDHLPGGRDLYEALADTFLRAYSRSGLTVVRSRPRLVPLQRH